MLEMAPSTLQAEPNSTLEVADYSAAFFSRDVVNPVDDCCFQVTDGQRLSQEHPNFQLAPKVNV